MAHDSILVTGSGQGLGRSLVERYVDLGYFVYGCSRRPSNFYHDSYLHFETDVADERSVCAMFKEISSRPNRLNMVVNNAGAAQSSLAMLTKASVAESIIRTNLLGTFLVTKEALKLMQRQRFGRIVNFSSINVPLASVGSSLYNASKSGIEAMTKTLAKECIGLDITINTLGLSLVENTGMVGALKDKAREEKLAALTKRELLTADEIVHALKFFQSPFARNITAQTIYYGGV